MNHSYNKNGLKKLIILKKYDIKCTYCNSKIKNLKNLTLDHVFPQSLGGKDCEENVVIACRKCNLNKRDLLLTDFIKKYNIKITKEISQFL